MSIKIINNYVLGALLSMLPLELNSFIYDKDTFNSNIVENSVGKKNTSKSIAVKIGVGTKYYTSQLNAEKSLDSLCRDRNTVLEDAWMFHNNILTDIGLYEDKTSVTLYLSVNDSVYSYAQGDTLTLYHIHPDPYNKKIFSPPSITDIINNAQLKQSIPNKINVIEKIFDGQGMWELALSDKLASKINKNPDKILAEYSYVNLIIDKNNYIRYITSITENNVLEQFNNTQSNPSLIINNYINTMNDIGVKLKFIPKENIGK